MDNASSHRNQKIKDLINKDNEILYSVPYQHFTNAIENWFSVLKSRLQKKEGLTYNHLQRNIAIVLRDIQLTTFNNNTTSFSFKTYLSLVKISPFFKIIFFY